MQIFSPNSQSESQLTFQKLLARRIFAQFIFAQITMSLFMPFVNTKYNFFYQIKSLVDQFWLKS